MKKLKVHNVPVTLQELNRKIDFEVKRLVREKEDGVVSYISRTTVLNGISKLNFKNRSGAKITLSYRLDNGGALRFAVEKQFVDLLPTHQKPSASVFGQTSKDISD